MQVLVQPLPDPDVRFRADARADGVALDLQFGQPVGQHAKVFG